MDQGGGLEKRQAAAAPPSAALEALNTQASRLFDDVGVLAQLLVRGYSGDLPWSSKPPATWRDVWAVRAVSRSFRDAASADHIVWKHFYERLADNKRSWR